MRPGQWLGLVLCVLFSAFFLTLSVVLYEWHPTRKIPVELVSCNHIILPGMSGERKLFGNQLTQVQTAVN